MVLRWLLGKLGLLLVILALLLAGAWLKSEWEQHRAARGVLEQQEAVLDGLRADLQSIEVAIAADQAEWRRETAVQMRALWEHNRHPIPALEDLPASVRAAVIDPLIPAKVDDLAMADRGLAWLYMQGWTVLYGVVALEVFGHMDPRIIESGEMFVEAIAGFAPKIGLEGDLDRLVAQIRERIARG